MKEPISEISGLSGKVELGCEDAAARTLDLEVEVTRSAGIMCGDDGVELPASPLIGELVPAQTEADAVIGTVFVRMPDLDKTSSERPAAMVEDKPGNSDFLAPGRVHMKFPISR